jgi:hypothetical protein
MSWNGSTTRENGGKTLPRFHTILRATLKHTPGEDHGVKRPEKAVGDGKSRRPNESNGVDNSLDPQIGE